MSKIMIEAKSRPIEIDLARTAVLVIDLQNDFGAKGGIFDSFGIPLEPIHKAVASSRPRARRASRRST